jgi:hypothetical protein
MGINRYKGRWWGFMKNAAEMRLGAKIYIPIFVKIGLCTQMLMAVGGNRQDNFISLTLKLNSVA